jgi:hypothetical protein
MTVKFSRSVRSIQADNLVPVLVGIIFFTLLMVGWIGWFFFAQIATYETSSRAMYQQEGYIVAEFSPSAQERIRRGQRASLQLTATTRQSPAIPLIVTDVDSATNQVRLIVRADEDEFARLQPGVSGQVKVQVQADSPALFVLRAAGLWPEG